MLSTILDDYFSKIFCNQISKLLVTYIFFFICVSKAGRLIPRVLERRREREERETRDENNPDDSVAEENNENEESGNRNVDVDLPSPRNVAQTLSGNNPNEEASNDVENNPSTEEPREDTET